MNTRPAFKFMFVVLLAWLPISAAQAETLLGTRTVAYKSDTDVIAVPGGQRFGQIRLCVSDHALRLKDIDVVYANGRPDNLIARSLIDKGECTRWFDLRGGRRNLARVVMRYSTFGNSGPRAVVQVFGR